MRAIASALLFTLGFAALPAAGQPALPADAEARRMAGEVVGQLIAEERVGYIRDGRGHDIVTILTHPRASPEGGLCEADHLLIERAPGASAEAPARTTRVEAEKWFFVLTDEDGQPLWEVENDSLGSRCAAMPEDRRVPFSAENAFAARAAVAGLAGLAAALRDPDSQQVEWDCETPCPSPAELAAQIEPLDPGNVGNDPARCPDGARCLIVTVLDASACGGWETQLRMDAREEHRFRSARVGFHRPIVCGQLEEGSGG